MMLSTLAKFAGGWRLYLLAGVAGALLMLGVYQAGVNAERRRGEAAQLRVELETVRRDKAIAERALVSAREAAAALERENRVNEEALDALRQRIDALPEGDRLPASGADLDELYP